MILRPLIGGVLLLAVLGATAPGGAVADDVDNAISALFAAAKAGDEAACMKAAAKVVGFRAEAAARLVSSLGDRTPAEVVWGLRCLRELRAEGSSETALALAGHADAGVRAEAVWTAYTLAGREAGPTLVRATRDSDAMVRRRAFDGLAECAARADGALEAALAGVTDADFWIVLQAFQVLESQPYPSDGKADPVVTGMIGVIPKLDDRNAKAAFDLLVRRGGAASAPAVEAALDSKKRPVILGALEAAGRLRIKSAVPRCARLAADRDLEVARPAIETLAQINDQGSLPFLVDQLELAREPERVDALALALRRMTGRLHGTNVAKWRAYLAQIGA